MTPAVEARQLAALGLARQGYAIAQVYGIGSDGTCACGRPDCPAPGKHGGKGWLEQATSDPATIRTRFVRGDPNYGVVAPAGSRLLIVDEDVPGALEALGPLPATLTVRTGLRPDDTRGRHLYGRLPDGIAEADLPYAWAGGEVRIAGNGHVVGPYSQHRSGVRYEPLNGSTVAVLPETWVRALIAAGRQQADERNAARDEGDPGWIVEEPGRHPFLLSRARHLRGVGVSGDRLRDELRRLNDERCRPPKSAAEVDAIAAWANERISDDPPEDDGPVLIDSPGVSPGIDAADLLELDIAPLRMIVPDLLPEGTTILAAPPKIGKSCLVYQVAVEVAIGGELFGRRVEAGSCLYLALEDGRRRGQDRLRAALAGRTMPRGRLEVRWGARRIGQGLEDDLRAWLDDHPDAALVAIDTLQRVRARSSGQRNAYEVDVEDLARLQDIFRDRQTALLIVHHSRKEAGDDFLASVSGTYGITGSADTTVVIRRKRLETFGTIVVTGRDIAEAELSVAFDGMLWQQAPDALGEASFERTEVYALIEAEGPLFPAAIAERLGLGRTSVQNMVGKLVDAGAVMRTTRGYVNASPVISPVTSPGLARARGVSVPDDSDDWESHRSHWGHTREGLTAAPLRTGQPLRDELEAIYEDANDA